MTRKVDVRTRSAPATRMNGVKGNGGGMRSSKASPIAPLDSVRRRTRCSFFGGRYRSSPFSPIFVPIQKVNDAPATPPVVARTGTTSVIMRPRAARIMTAASTANGSEKKMVESRAPNTRRPSGEAETPTAHRASDRITLNGGVPKPADCTVADRSPVWNALAIRLPAAGVHFEVRVVLERLERHERPPIAERQALLGASVVASTPGGRNHRFQILSAGAGAERGAQIDASSGVEAEIPDAVGREAAPVARPAERVCRGRNDAERRAFRQREAICGRG